MKIPPPCSSFPERAAAWLLGLFLFSTIQGWSQTSPDSESLGPTLSQRESTPKVLGRQNPQALQEAQPFATRWLEMMDQGLYEKCYEASSPLVHEVDTREKWVGSLNATRGVFGPVDSRDYVAHTYSPEGVVKAQGPLIEIVYLTHFRNKIDRYEDITLHLEGGDWAPVAYICIPKPDENTATVLPDFTQDDVKQEEHSTAPPKLPQK